MTQQKSVHLLEVGEELEPLKFIPTAELNQQYLYGVEDYNPLYIEGDHAYVHPSLLLNMSNFTRSPSYYLDPQFGAIHAAEETIFVHPATIGKTITVSWKVTDAYPKRGRPYQEIAVSVVDEDGQEILRRIKSVTYSSIELAIK